MNLELFVKGEKDFLAIFLEKNVILHGCGGEWETGSAYGIQILV